MIARAIEMHLDLMAQSGDVIPTPSTAIQFSIDDSTGEELCTWVDVDVPQPATH
jgi:hypothetical protein